MLTLEPLYGGQRAEGTAGESSKLRRQATGRERERDIRSGGKEEAGLYSFRQHSRVCNDFVFITGVARSTELGVWSKAEATGPRLKRALGNGRQCSPSPVSKHIASEKADSIVAHPVLSLVR